MRNRLVGYVIMVQQHCSHTCSTEDILYDHAICKVSHSNFSADDCHLHRGVAESPVTAFSIAHTSVTMLPLIVLYHKCNCVPINVTLIQFLCAGQSLRNLKVRINWKLRRAQWKLPARVIVVLSFRADVLYWRRWKHRLCDRAYRSERDLWE